mgnify:CR=1 FL=1
MPYTMDNPPATVKNLPKGAQRLFIDAFNAVARDGGSEDNARMAGWANVKRKYKQVDGKWVAKSERSDKESKMDELIDTVHGVATITEAKDGQGQTYNRVRFLSSRGDEVNANKRVYPTALWQRETERINSGKVVLGQSGHPFFLEPANLLDVFLKFEKAEMADKDFIAEAKIIPTARGKDFVEIAKAGVPVPVSTRGKGTVKMEKRDGEDVSVVQEDYELEAIDVVVPGTPSFKDAAMLRFEAKEAEEEPKKKRWSLKASLTR